MKRPTAASRKKVTPENLAGLGAERLAAILAEVADSRPDLKRRLRMELAAEEGVEHLLAEIDKRVLALQTSRSRVSWRQRHAFVRDLEALRRLIVERLADLDRPAAVDRTFAFLALARRVQPRIRDREGALAAVFVRTATSLGGLLADGSSDLAGARLADAVGDDPANWAEWLASLAPDLPREVARAALRQIAAHADSSPALMRACRQLADAAGEVDAFRATYKPAALKTPEVAAEVGARLLAAGRLEEARAVLEQGRPAETSCPLTPGAAAAQFVWENVWIEYLEASGEAEAAQAARWASFERTLSADRARAFVTRLSGFADVEAEEQAFALARQFSDFAVALSFLMAWPALREAAELIEARADEAILPPETAELWAGRLRPRYPMAAHTLLRKAAAAAFRRREFATCDRLTAEADAVGV
jgi:hypothetical protein